MAPKRVNTFLWKLLTSALELCSQVFESSNSSATWNKLWIWRPVQTIERVLRHSHRSSHEHDVREVEKKCFCRRGWAEQAFCGKECLCVRPENRQFLFVLRQYSSASEHIHSMFAACLLTVHTSEHHVFGYRIRLCREICSIVCTGLYQHFSYVITNYSVTNVISLLLTNTAYYFLGQVINVTSTSVTKLPACQLLTF